MKNKKKSPKESPKKFDKYKYYMDAVQSPDTDSHFIRKFYKKARGVFPKVLREDFCGTFALCDHWVRMNKDHVAIGVDLDPEPIEYGLKNFYAHMNPNQQSRMFPIQESVLNAKLPKADVICALNFSYFIFRQRTEMRQYFATCLKNLKKNGIIVLDVLGGSAYQLSHEQPNPMGSYTYYWEQYYFNPINQHGKFFIHFKKRGEKKHLRVFEYEWRLWGMQELRDLLAEVGFRKTTVYWEGTNSKGEGNDVFKPSERGDECESWIAYLVAES